MTSDQNKLVVRRYIEEVMNTGNVDRIAEFVSAEYVEVYRGVRSSVGLDGAREHVLGVRQTYPDLHVTIDRQIAEGEWVVTQVTGKGTHMGSWLGMRPTGKAVEINAVNVDRVVGGRIVEHGGAANSLEALLKIGAIRVVGPETERDAEPDAPPNIRPPTQSPPSQGIPSFDSQRTSSSGGCG
jgi:predicted ester cyclase